MDVFEAVRTVLAVREYQDRPVPKEILLKVVEAGRLTASASNKQPWHFILIEERQTLRKLAEIATTGPYIAAAAAAVVVVVERTKWAVSDASRAVQSMVLAAWEDGVGSNWVGGIERLVAVKPLLEIPEELDVLCILPLGYPREDIGQGKKDRKPLAEVASSGRYNNPLSG